MHATHRLHSALAPQRPVGVLEHGSQGSAQELATAEAGEVPQPPNPANAASNEPGAGPAVTTPVAGRRLAWERASSQAQQTNR